MGYKYPEIEKYLKKMTGLSFVIDQIQKEMKHQKIVVTGIASLAVQGLTDQWFDYSQISVYALKPCKSKYLRYHIIKSFNEIKYTNFYKIPVTDLIDSLNVSWQEDGKRYRNIFDDVIEEAYIYGGTWEEIGVDRLLFQGEWLEGIKDAAEHYEVY